jgi:integrase
LAQIQEEIHACDDPMSAFLYALKAPESRRQYPKRLKVLFDYLGLVEPLENQALEFVERARGNSKWAYDSFIRFISYQKQRVTKGEIVESTISNYYKAAKLFCEMNDLTLNWKKISRGIPQGRHAANDRAPTLEELRKLASYPDRRIKAIVCLMMSTGIRIGAFDTMRWKHIVPIFGGNGNEVIAAKLVVYPGDSEEYCALMTPESYNAISSWMSYRASYGEKINNDSWVMRDLWQTTESKYGANYGVAHYPKQLKHSGVKSLLERAARAQGIFKPLPQGVRRREWKIAHGIRKYTNTMMIKSHVNMVVKEYLLGHNLRLDNNYFRPNFEDDIVPEFLKALDLLTLDESNRLQRRIEELTLKNIDNDYIVRAKLQERDEQINAIQKQLTSLITAFSKMNNQAGKNELAERLIEEEIYVSKAETLQS